MENRRLPAGGRQKIWDMFRGRPIEYLAAIRIRDASVTVGNELKRNPPIGSMEKTNYAVANYIQRLVLLDNEKGDTKGIRTEWEEVRIGDHFLQTLLKIQTLTNDIQAAAGKN